MAVADQQGAQESFGGKDVPDLSLSNVVAGLIGGAGASVFTFAGAFYLQTHAERRRRRCRLLALETEIRWNRVSIKALLERHAIIGKLTDHCWQDNYVALAADLPHKVYPDLRLHYFSFAQAEHYYDLAARAEATKEELDWLAQWRDEAELLQAFVTGELHLTWKLRFLVEVHINRMMRMIPGRRDKKLTKEREKS